MSNIPIYQRAQLLMKEKQQRLAEYKRLKEQQEEEECNKYSFRPNIGRERDHRTVDQFLEEVDYWIGRKNESLHQMQQEKQLTELRGVTFKPQINKKSQRIVQDQNSSMLERCQKTQMKRQIKEQHHLIQELKKTPFSPQLNVNSIKLNQKGTTPERSRSPIQQYTPRIGKSTSPTPIRKRTETTPTRQNTIINKSMNNTANNSNNNSKKAVLPLQNISNKYMMDIVNKTPSLF